ncbi:MAG: hypothetical protein C4584_02680 [Armatimonadetes bacterium]|nr:MAG: hypothetical protein C4584_02680 [Armatimonadota bacterium]
MNKSIEVFYGTLIASLITGAGSGCATPSSIDQKPTPNIASLSIPATPYAQRTEFSAEKPNLNWESLSAAERINLLEREIFPPNSDFKPTQEMALATAQLFKDQTDLPISAETLGQNVEFLKAEEFSTKYQQSSGFILNGKNKKLTETTQIIYLDEENKKVLINKDVFTSYTLDQNREKKAKPILKDKRFYMVYLKGLLFKAFTHLYRTTEDYPIGPPIPDSDQAIVITHFEGFMPKGRSNQNGKEISIPTTEDAAIGLAASIIGSKYEPYIVLENDAKMLGLLSYLNKRTNISNEEFTDYVLGKKPLRDYFAKLALQTNPQNPHDAGGAMALTFIGMVGNNILTPQQAKTLINEIFPPKPIFKTS